MGLFKHELMISKKTVLQSIKKSSRDRWADKWADKWTDKKRKKIYRIDG